MDGIITQYADVNRAVIESLEHCKVIIKYGIGINNIDVEAATEKGIYVCNIPDYGVDEVTNQTIAFMFALARKLYISNNYLGLFSWLLDRGFMITPNIQSNNNNIKTNIDANKSILLKTLYDINPKVLLQCFSKK